MLPHILHETLIETLVAPCIQVVAAEKAPTLNVCGNPPNEGESTLTSGATLLPTDQHTKRVDVAAAIFFRQVADAEAQIYHEVLLTLRPRGRVYAGYWEFPGGKMEIGETAEAALIREIQEELGVTVVDPQPFAQREHDYPHAEVRLHFFLVQHWRGTFSLREHDGMVWQDLRQINVAPLLPANGGLIDDVRHHFTASRF